MIPPQLRSVLSRNPKIMSGAVCFAGTRVPVQILIDTLDCGESVEYFLDGFPDVTREQAEAVVRWEQDQARQILGLELAA